ncbi:hypothetical protein I316_05100 [Kwoniella heveanensis BCC8398]|uniref:PCI domain-containing protein n=1 Tax=Kwoniella heveanensis BCC8398 TaxID=1296120 RepID=A0A1B9GQV8_9TREE|nr:hypothetical protein I316_05100 [Kwoniella heveanensis BCC8398]
MSALIGTFISHVEQCFSTGSADNLVTSLPLDLSHPFFNPLSQALLSVPESDVSPASIRVQLIFVSENVKENFSSFLSAVLANIRWQQASSESERLYRAYSKLQHVYGEANKVYGMSSDDGSYMHAFLNPLVVNLAKLLVKASNKAAQSSTLPLRHPQSARSIRDSTRQTIERSMQIANSNMSDSEWNAAGGQQHVVGDIVWALGNVLFRIYAERKLHTQAADLSKTLSSLSPAEDKRLSSRGYLVSATEISQSYYWRGKLGVVLLDMRGAKYWLDKAWRFCPGSDVHGQEGWSQRRSILIRLIPVNLLLGLLPSQAILQQYDLPEYVPLIQAYKTGNVPAWRKILEQRREWFRRRSVWLILYERGEILVWRNLFRRALQIYYSLDPSAAKNRCPTWVFLSATHQTFSGSGEIEDGNVELEDIICVISSLVDQSLILGNLAYSQRQLVMKPSPDGMGGFPRVSQVNPRTVNAIA